MINRISRNEAKEKTLLSVLDFDDIKSDFPTEVKNLKSLFPSIIQIWNNKVNTKARKYACMDYEMEILNISESTKIGYFLNDKIETGYGLYLASANEIFKKTQNDFIDKIQECFNKSIKYGFLKNNFKEKKLFQNCNKNEVLNICLNKGNLQNSFNDLLNLFSIRDEFDKMEFNYEKIESYIVVKYLVGKKRFSEDQIFFLYKYEYIQSSFLSNFIDNFNIIPLSDRLKKLLDDLITTINGKNNLNIMENIWISIQMLIFFLQDKADNSNFTLSSILSNRPNFLKINPILERFFVENIEFKVEHLLEIFNYFEFHCFEKIKQNLPRGPNKKLDLEQKQRLNEYFRNKKDFYV